MDSIGGGLILLQGAQIGAGAEPPGPPHFNHFNQLSFTASWSQCYIGRR